MHSLHTMPFSARSQSRWTHPALPFILITAHGRLLRTFVLALRGPRPSALPIMLDCPPRCSLRWQVLRKTRQDSWGHEQISSLWRSCQAFASLPQLTQAASELFREPPRRPSSGLTGSYWLEHMAHCPEQNHGSTMG